MVDHAVVIGIDHYTRPEWALRAAVADARAFARWVTEPGAGRATPETTDLLLSPRPDDDGEDPFPSTRATQAALGDVMVKLGLGQGVGGDRLWFYYAGHALTAQGAGPGTPPALMPDDVEDLDRYFFLGAIELTKLIAMLQLKPPATQLFFIDACRGLVQTEEAAFATTQLIFDLSKVPGANKATSRQAVLCGTTAGQLANEVGAHGLFSKALLEGLRARGPELAPDFDRQDLVLTFDAVTRYTKQRVRQLAEDLRPGAATLPAQDPWPSLLGLSGSEPVARFDSAPKARLMMEVEPAKARKVAVAGIRTWLPHAGRFELVEQRAAPLSDIVQWDLPLGDHGVQVEADGYTLWHRTVTLRDDDSLHARLVAGDDTMRNGGLESLAPVLPAADGVGRLVVRGGDALARIEVFNDKNERVGAGWERLSLSTLPVGPYRVEVSWPGVPAQSHREVVWGGRTTSVKAEPHGVNLPAALEKPLAERGLSPDGPFTHPSEAFGRTLTDRVGALLTWAAVAGWSGDGNGSRLRLLRVRPEGDPDPGGAYAHVVIADVGGTSGHDPSSPLQATIRVGDATVPVEPVRSLPELARHRVLPLTDPWTELELVAPGVALRIDVPQIAGAVWIVVVAREADGRLAITRHLHPLSRGLTPLVRLADASAAALQAGLPLLDDEAERIGAENPDPLTLVVLGYRLANEARRDGLRAVLDELGDALPGVADVHVLRARAAADAAAFDTAMSEAQTCGRPLVREGYERLLAWTTEQAAREGLPPVQVRTPAMGDQVWTVLDARPHATISPSSPAIDVTALRQLAPSWAQPILGAAAATVRVAVDGGYGSGFVVEGGQLVTAGFVVPQPVGPLVPAQRVAFDDTAQTWHSVGEVLSRADGRYELVRLGHAGPDVAALEHANVEPRVGQRIAVIGFPAASSGIPIEVIEATFGVLPTGHKMITPGVLTSVEGDELHYDCWTLRGTAGGPIVDLATGAVLGVHIGGQYDEARQTKTGFGVRLKSV